MLTWPHRKGSECAKAAKTGGAHGTHPNAEYVAMCLQDRLRWMCQQASPNRPSAHVPRLPCVVLASSSSSCSHVGACVRACAQGKVLLSDWEIPVWYYLLRNRVTACCTSTTSLSSFLPPPPHRPSVLSSSRRSAHVPPSLWFDITKTLVASLYSACSCPISGTFLSG